MEEGPGARQGFPIRDGTPCHCVHRGASACLVPRWPQKRKAPGGLSTAKCQRWRSVQKMMRTRKALMCCLRQRPVIYWSGTNYGHAVFI